MSYIHKVFVSYHHENDQAYRDQFERLFAYQNKIFISKSVQIGEIAANLATDTVRAKIRDEYLRDSTVTIVLIGKETWKRKHVDWEISSSIRATQYSTRSGLLGILLPSHPSCYAPRYDPWIVPPRLVKNEECGFAHIYDWSRDPGLVSGWIQAAFDRRFEVEPDNSYEHFRYNRSGERWY